MTSQFEKALIHDKVSRGNIRSTLCGYLDDGTSLYRMRATSNTLRDAADLDRKRLWGVLYLFAPLSSADKIFILERISPFCKTLTIKVKLRPIPLQKVHKHSPLILDRWRKSRPITEDNEPELLPPYDLAAYEVDRQLWTYIFKRFKDIESLTLAVDGDPAWPGRGEIEAALTSLRCSLERAELKKVRSLTLSPIHFCGILHFRWSGFGALYEVPSAEVCANLWQSITLLDIRLRSPGHTDTQLTEVQTRMSVKLLQDYLRSFTPTLKCLRFVWLDNDGPSPLLLDDEPGMESVQRLFWPVLEELHFGNIAMPNKTVQVIQERAPNVHIVKALRSTHRFSRVDPEDGGAWADVDIERLLDRRRQVAQSTTSSFYSQDG